MDNEMNKELFNNEEFIKDLFESKSYEEAQAKLAAKDVDVSVEELKKVLKLLQKKQTGELSDEELEAVSGGSLSIIFGLLGGSIVAMGASGGALYAMNHC